MQKYKGRIIDAHTHIFPEKIAAKATASVGAFYGIEMSRIGLLDTLLDQMDRNGICHSFILSTATVPAQVRHINEFLISVMQQYKDKFTAFGTVHPGMENMTDEIDYIRSKGITGLKFHPDFQAFAVDDPVMDPVYEKAQAEKIPIVFHAGDNRYHYSTPPQFKAVMKKFPDLIAVAAHFGGYSQWQEAAELLADTGLFYDTSSSLFGMTPETAVNLLNKYDKEKMMFGTDFPMWSAEDEFVRIEKLNLDSETLERIMFRNAENFLKAVE